jgi:hypothetical protein
MKLTNTPKLGALALSGTLSLLAVAASSAALVAPLTPEIPGVALGAAVNNFGGTVVASQTLNFADVSVPSNFSGSLRSTVVRNPGGTLDFYYQLANTTTATNILDPEIFRLTLNDFAPEFSTSGASYETFVIGNGLTGITGAGAFANGTNAAFSADRQNDPPFTGVGTFGFDFGDDHFLDDVSAPFTNLQPGQTSNFLVVRTNAPSFRNTQALVVGAGTAFTQAFTPIPEPATALVGLALASFVGCAELGRKRRRTAKA